MEINIALSRPLERTLRRAARRTGLTVDEISSRMLRDSIKSLEAPGEMDEFVFLADRRS